MSHNKPKAPHSIALLSTSDIERFWSKLNRADAAACWVWPGGKDKDGYGKFQIGPNGKQTHFRAHRVALALTIGDFTGLALHSCDNPPCCNPAHLSAGTQRDNCADRERRGRHPHLPRPVKHGAAHYKATITEDQAIEILRLGKAAGPRRLAEQFNTTINVIYTLLNRRSWRHLSVSS